MQEVSGEEFQGKDILVGPILRVVCNESVEFLKPVTIQLPVSLADEQPDVANWSTCRVRVLFLRSDGGQKEWIEITNDLTSPPRFVGGIVRFQVQRLSGYVNHVNFVLVCTMWKCLVSTANLKSNSAYLVSKIILKVEMRMKFKRKNLPKVATNFHERQLILEEKSFQLGKPKLD